MIILSNLSRRLGLVVNSILECLAKPSLASLADKEVSRILEKNTLRPITKRSIRRRKGLREELETIRGPELAMERGEESWMVQGERDVYENL